MASGERVLGALIADAQVAATRAAAVGGAQIAFMNSGGLRADLTPGPGGVVTYGQLFATQPFGNALITKSFTGRQLRDILEQQFAGGADGKAAPGVLLPSSALRYAYDLSRPAGARVTAVTVAGAPLRDDAVYRVVTSEFLSTGGDGFSTFRAGVDPVSGPLDIDALVAWFAGDGTMTPPATDRIINLTPAQAAPNVTP